MLTTKRAYEAPSRGDGCRILVDRVWPRGVTKDALACERWMRELAPSTPLRKWFAHDPQKWTEFKLRYFAELDEREELVTQLLEICSKRRVTLVFGAKDEAHCNAAALKEYLERRLPK